MPAGYQDRIDKFKNLVMERICDTLKLLRFSSMAYQPL